MERFQVICTFKTLFGFCALCISEVHVFSGDEHSVAYMFKSNATLRNFVGGCFLQNVKMSM